jgi:toxin ParE1/3/4
MAYRVELTMRAERELEDLYDRISAEDSADAANWFNGLQDAIFSLERLPRRCPIAPEGKIWGRTLRHLTYGAKPNVHRVIYEINEVRKLIWIRTVRHGAMNEFTPER